MNGPIEALTVCVGYADFLAATIPHNIGQLDRWLIVTSEADEETRELCRKHDLKTLLSDDHEISAGGTGGGVFNKGRLIQRGLEHLSHNAWRLHLDADIVLPRQFRRILGRLPLDTSKIYGCDRVMIPSYEDWQKAQYSGVLSHSHSSVNMPKGYALGDRWMTADTGHVPIGFLQLWHSDADEWHGQKIRKYPMHHGAAHRTDVQFGLEWDWKHRQLLAEILVVHLASDPNSKLGANWNGRTTPRFGPCPHGQKVGADGRCS